MYERTSGRGRLRRQRTPVSGVHPQEGAFCCEASGNGCPASGRLKRLPSEACKLKVQRQGAPSEVHEESAGESHRCNVHGQVPQDLGAVTVRSWKRDELLPPYCGLDLHFVWQLPVVVTRAHADEVACTSEHNGCHCRSSSAWMDGCLARNRVRLVVRAPDQSSGV